MKASCFFKVDRKAIRIYNYHTRPHKIPDMSNINVDITMITQSIGLLPMSEYFNHLLVAIILLSMLQSSDDEIV